MKWLADLASPVSMHFEIRHHVLTDAVTGQTEEGYALYVWTNGKGSHDYLQDSLEIAKGFALEKFGVPPEAWRVDTGETG